VVQLLEPEADKLAIDLLLELPDDPLQVDADREKLQQVLLNIIRNSLEALEDEGGTIRVELERAEGGEMLAIRVHDTGPGIPEEILSRIFEPFFSTKPMGTGLGMAICHSLIQQHGGVLRVSCEQGTMVEILLPMTR
jgi:signal transduction histidine kinase